MTKWCTIGTLVHSTQIWKLSIRAPPPSTQPPPASPYVETKSESPLPTHLMMLRLWCELCVIVCPCFLDEPAERGPYLNTRTNKKTLCNQTQWSPCCCPSVNRSRCSRVGGGASELAAKCGAARRVSHLTAPGPALSRHFLFGVCSLLPAGPFVRRPSGGFEAFTGASSVPSKPFHFRRPPVVG